jgi:hypothetical protein
MIPAPNAIGELPPGMHPATLAEVEAVFVTTPRRCRLFEGLRRAIQNLYAAGVRRVQRNRADDPKGIVQLDLEEMA